MEYGELIYFDHAATSFPKPRAVVEEVVRCMSDYGGNAGRGSHALAMAAAKKIYECRTRLAEHFGVDDPARVIFTLNTTHALNIAIKGLLREGDHVLLSDIEHNSVLRPISKLKMEGKITSSEFPSMVLDPRRSSEKILAGIARWITPKTKLLITTHASNLCSVTMPIREMGAFCHRNGIRLIVDGAQSAGHERIAVDEMKIDALCLPSHKGLLGPQGCGVLILGKNIAPELLETLVEGGNGMASLERAMPLVIPERYETGTLPSPAIAGLSEGIKIIDQLGLDAIAEHERTLFQRVRELLGGIEDVTLYAPEYEGAVLLFNLDGIPSERLGRQLAERGICVRSGYHCSALGHKTLGTPDGGAVRASFGIYNDLEEVETFAQVLREIAKGE